jgi:hypothetical protein
MTIHSLFGNAAMEIGNFLEIFGESMAFVAICGKLIFLEISWKSQDFWKFHGNPNHPNHKKF